MRDGKLDKLKEQYEKQVSESARHGEQVEIDNPSSQSENFFDNYVDPPAMPEPKLPQGQQSQLHDTHRDIISTSASNASRLFEKRQRSSRRRIQKVTMNNTPNSTWKIILGIIVVISAIVLVITIWNARYAILNSVTEFIWAALPIVLVIALVIWLFKKLIKGG